MAIRLNAAPDPIIDCGVRVRRGVDLSEFNRRPVRALVYVSGDAADWCGVEQEDEMNGNVRCTRPKDHPAHWKHVAANRYEVLATWGGGPAPANGAFVDPEDGTPEDPAESVVKLEDIALGGVYRLKDRKNILLVVGGVGDSKRDDGQIDVLDFTKREYRGVPPEELVADPAAVMTPEDLIFSIEYGQQTRMKIKDEAVSNYHAGRWCEAGLQDALRDLGLPKYVPTQMGEVTIRLPYSAVSGMNTSKIKKLVEDAVNLDELKAALGAAVDPEDDDELAVKTDDLKVKVENVGRR
jgi:hypothetical protein